MDSLVFLYSNLELQSVHKLNHDSHLDQNILKSPVKFNQRMEIINLIVLIHIFVGFVLVYFAAKAFKKTKYIPMLYLTFGFLLITIGDTIIGDLNIFDESSMEIAEELIEISGFVLVIIAVIKS